MGQSNEPGAISWAPGVSAPDVIVPPPGDQASGFAPLDTPPYSWVNWAWSRLSSWVNYLASFVVNTADAFVVSGMTIVEVPNATQVKINTGTALAGSKEVEVTAIETLNMPNAAGTGGVGSIYYYVLDIDSAGVVGISTTAASATEIEEFIYLVRATWQNSVQPTKALLGLVVDEGQANFDTAHIYDLRQTKPISTAIVQAASLDMSDLRAAVARPRFGSQVQSDPIRRDVSFKLGDYTAALDVITPNFRPGLVRCTFKLVEVKSLTTAGPDGLSFHTVAPWSEVLSTALVGIALHDGTAVLTPGSWTSLNGGMNYWEGEIDPSKVHTVQLHLKALQSLTDYVLHCETEHGVTASVPVQTPAT